MVQIGTKGGQIQVRYIVSQYYGIYPNEYGVYPDFKDYNPLDSQIIEAGHLAYLYFAEGAEQITGNPTHTWIIDPSQSYYTVGFILWFRYEGETEARSISLPPLVQQITQKQ